MHSAFSGRADDGRSGRSPLTSVCPTQRARSVRRSARSPRSRRARRGTGRRLFPSDSTPRSGRRRSDVRQIPVGSKLALRAAPRSSPSVIPGFPPPMIPASAIDRSASAIIRSDGSRSRSGRRPASAASRRVARAGRRSSHHEFRVVERVQRVPEPEHHVVRDVDDVRYWPHARSVQASAEPAATRRCGRRGRAA